MTSVTFSATGMSLLTWLILLHQVLYPILPAFLDSNPFKEGHSLTGKGAPVLGSSGLTVPDQVQQVVDVLSETQRLLSDCQLHPEISTQLIAFLFYFINASLFNLLMERGTRASCSLTYNHTLCVPTKSKRYLIFICHDPIRKWHFIQIPF